MAQKEIKYAINGIGCFIPLFLIMFALKLAQVGVMANVSWWWVTAPLWAIPALVVGAFASLGIIYVLLLLAAWIVDLIGNTLKEMRKND